MPCTSPVSSDAFGLIFLATPWPAVGLQWFRLVRVCALGTGQGLGNKCIPTARNGEAGTVNWERQGLALEL